MEVEFCPRCSTVVNRSYLYCPSCGARLHEVPEFSQVLDESLKGLNDREVQRQINRLNALLCRLAALEDALDAWELVRNR